MIDEERRRQREHHLAQRLRVGTRNLQTKLLGLHGLWSGREAGCIGRLRSAPALAPSREAVETVAPFLAHPNRELRVAAAVALRAAGLHVAPVAPALTQALSDRDPIVRLQVMKVLRQLPALSAEQAAALRLSLADPTREVRWMAAHALSRLAPEAASDWVMADWLVHPLFDGARELATLKSLGIVAPARAAGFLAEVQRDGPHAAEAAELLGRVLERPADPAIVSLLEQRLAERGAPGFASALGRLGPLGEEALLRQLGAPQGQVRRAAVWGLRVRRSAPPELLALLGDPDVGVQIEAVSLLTEQAALPLASLQRWTEAQAFETLAAFILELRQPTGHVTPLLQHLADPRDRRVRAKALTQLDRLEWRLHASK
jgi:HEAT repeat protein